LHWWKWITWIKKGIAVAAQAPASTAKASASVVKSLTKKAVEQIFTGDVTDWSAVGGSGGFTDAYSDGGSSKPSPINFFKSQRDKILTRKRYSRYARS